MALSGTQVAVLREVLYGPANRIIVYGTTRSGKTRACTAAFGALAIARPGEYLIGAPTAAQVRGVILAELRVLYGDSLSVNAARKQAYLGNSTIHLFSGKTEDAEESIRGLTVRGVYIDEAVAVPRNLIEQAGLRASVAPRVRLLSTNPDSPYHFLKQAWVDRAEHDARTAAYRMTFADNPSLGPEYEAEQREELSGAMAARMLDGEWALASGSVYGNPAAYTGAAPSDAPALRRVIGVDYADASPTHAVLAVLRDLGDERVWFVEGEWRHPGDTDVTPDAKARLMLDALAPEDTAIHGILVDPSARIMANAIRRCGRKVRGANNKVDVGIQRVQQAINRGRLMISPRCTHLLREMANYTYDPRALLRGEEKPLKKDDHGPDALRYALMAPVPAGIVVLDVGD